MRRLAGDLVHRAARLGPVRLLITYAESNASNYAAGLAFDAFMAMFPLILGILTIVGLALGNPGVESRVLSTILAAFPAGSRTQVADALRSFHEHAGVFGAVSVGGLLWTGVGFFGAMEFAFDQVYGVKQRDFLHQKVMGMGMMAVFLAGILVSVGASVAIAFLPAVPYLGFLAGWSALTAVLAAIYRVVPNAPVKLPDVWPGAVLAGLLVQVLTLVFPQYVALASGANAYGGAFALFFILAAWLYLMSQFLLIGLVLNRMVSPERSRRVAAAPRKTDLA